DQIADPAALSAGGGADAGPVDIGWDVSRAGPAIDRQGAVLAARSRGSLDRGSRPGRRCAMTISVDQSIALHQRRQSAELAMLRQIASAPKWLGAVAREQGIMPDHFGDPDTRILAAALLEPGEWTVAQRLRVAAEMLRRD